MRIVPSHPALAAFSAGSRRGPVSGCGRRRQACQGRLNFGVSLLIARLFKIFILTQERKCFSAVRRQGYATKYLADL